MIRQKVEPFSILPKQPVISLVGAGGKTSLMFFLARQLPGSCITTTTTKVGFTQIGPSDEQCDFATFQTDINSFLKYKSLWVSPVLEPVKGKLQGFDCNSFSQLARQALPAGFSIVNEADGAATRHLKAPGEHEPVIPSDTNAVLHCCGLDTLGKQINAENVHRPEIFCSLTDTQPGDFIDESILIRLILHPQGGFKNTPGDCLRISVLSHVDNQERVQRAENIAGELLRQGVDAVWITRLCPDGKILVTSG